MSVNELAELHPNSLAAQDHESSQTLPPDLQKWARRAAEQSGRGPAQLQKELGQAKRWPGKISTLEYFSQRLFDHDKAGRKEFISEWLHWPIHDIVNDPDWANKTVDKRECTSVLEEHGIATIPVLIVVDPTGASHQDTPVASTPQQLSEFLATAEFPIFAKPNTLLGSFGAFRIESFDGETALLHNGDRWPLDVLMNEVMSAIPYVLQRVISNHDKVSEFAEGLATLRTVNMVSGTTVVMSRAILKIPVAGQIADNLWREGNVVANVDPETGVIDRIVSGLGPDLVEITEHPDTGQRLLGMALPTWDEVRALNTETAQAFVGLRYQTQDIAFTNDGPLVVEVNSGGSFALPQIASGRGFLSSENMRFFESCGVNFRSLEDPHQAAA